MDAEPQPIYYFPYKQLAWQPPVVMLRTAVPPRILEVSGCAKRWRHWTRMVPVFQVRTMEELLSTQVTEPRFHTVLLGCFAGIALLLTMVGLYGVMAYSVTRRTREIGVRIALGASRSMVLSMVLKQALVLLAAGLVLGLAASLAADRLLAKYVVRRFVAEPGGAGLIGPAGCLDWLARRLLARAPGGEGRSDGGAEVRVIVDLRLSILDCPRNETRTSKVEI